MAASPACGTVGDVKPGRGRSRILRAALAAALLGVSGVGVAALVAWRLADPAVPPADVADVPSADPVEPGCDFVPGAAECPEIPLVEQPTFEGAVERFRSGVTVDGDARFLVLSQTDYDSFLLPVLGPAAAQDGRAVARVPVWEASYEGLDRESGFSWEQQWDLVGGSVMFEQLFVFATEGEAVTFLGNHVGFMADLGVEPTKHPRTGPGREGMRPVLFRFVDSDAGSPARRCVNRTLVVSGRIVFSVSLLTGGDCTTPDPSLPAGIVTAVRDRAVAVLG